MRIDLAPFLRSGESSHAFAFDEAFAQEGLPGGRVQVTGQASYLGEGEFQLAGTIAAELELACARCLAPVAYSARLPFSERFSRTGSEDAYTYAGETVDLSEMVREHIVLSLPMRILCRDDCKGLCPSCGCNLNDAACHCAAQADN